MFSQTESRAPCLLLLLVFLRAILTPLAPTIIDPAASLGFRCHTGGTQAGGSAAALKSTAGGGSLSNRHSLMFPRTPLSYGLGEVRYCPLSISWLVCTKFRASTSLIG